MAASKEFEPEEAAEQPTVDTSGDQQQQSP